MIKTVPHNISKLLRQIKGNVSSQLLVAPPVFGKGDISSSLTLRRESIQGDSPSGYQKLIS